MKRRIPEYFGEEKGCKQITVGNFPKKLYKQERDWTCSVACIRTLLSGFIDNVQSENDFIAEFNMKPGPHYSKDVKDRGMIKGHDAVFSCDIDKDDITISIIGELLKKGYYVMVESMYNYAHWYVVLGYCAIEDETDLERHKMLIYDPYYDNVGLINVDEFKAMWCDAENHVKEFIAVKANILKDI